uniref:Pre-mRNA-processing factor 17 n=1 Tax=Mucochytrium quahogii TaxID=96639 RepID=A0A7S2WK01_9STRA|mmetsp:Transcript_17838/g.28897  ORF Transcript_17838/g.28897 Transcript_17838/m.28897 type:complete len:545 (+) Transcript_17838:317-1951(+)|eukprot:CAMPEP_0203773446 /NCGR_PEP_ID=MMETSP0099_2-20121227/4662_1 /ASSEMBLY_ACC=CAM_ASM_000209 /TAXON_ID=96639 /ORGANISM=" , Strain NY0313808BC1" /LENGTH=544 /DNA_ID=CAMNT_0050671277 /DNA_START=234 /DNA_END=1868 /DNA_ORIENTATION=-
MSALVDYLSESSSDQGDEGMRSIVKKKGLELAPHVDIDDRHTLSDASYSLSRPVDVGRMTVAKSNLTAQAMWGASQGPENPYTHKRAQVKEMAVDEATFDEAMYKEYAKNEPGAKKRKVSSKGKKPVKLGSTSAGPWAEESYDSDESVEGQAAEISQDQKDYLKELDKRREAAIKRQAEAQEQEGTSAATFSISGKDLEGKVSSKFEGSEEVDYQGRGWTQPPASLRADGGDHECFIPKKVLHEYRGHSKGVQVIEFSPKYGHLLLSGSMDTTCKIWGVYESTGGGNGRGAKRTYSGHAEAVRSVCFNADGSQFASASYDKTILLWDVESGKPSESLFAGAVPQCVSYVPNDSNIILAGCSNSKIIQWDRREGKVVQEYSHHLGGVNTITFFDNSTRFLSTSDDKKMLVWEYNIPVPSKYIADPSMQSMPVVRVHPSGEYVACQSMDNQILTFEIKERVRGYKKRFKGHNSAGFACDIDFSPNGKYIISGESSGKVFFWNWKTGKKFRELKAHKKHPCIGARWHPIEPSWVATSAWDGIIKLWG